MDGLLLVDKPAGMSSFDVVRWVRRVAGTRKVGHTGTLDPLATGLLPIVVGKCTKLARFLSLDAKAYEFGMQLGRETASGDAEGEVVRECGWEHVTRADFERVLTQFQGEISQRPPVFSAIKIDGKRAYQRARDGEEVEMAARPVQIHSLDLLELALPDARLHTHCGAGTYVRSLARDIGEALGSCAFATSIRRTQVGDFSLSEARPLEEITPENVAACVLSPMQMMRAMPRHVADARECRAMGFGQRIEVAGLRVSGGEFVAVADEDSNLVAITQVEAVGETARLKPVRVLKSL